MTASLPFSPARTVTLLLALLGAALYLDRTERAAKPATAPVRTLPKDFDAATAWVLTSFHEPNGTTRGLHLSYSADGFRWTELRARDNTPILVPTIGDRILRDPSLCFRSNRFHLVWTSSWGGTGNASLGFGYTSSADLLTWSAQQFVRVRHERADAINVWAPSCCARRARRSRSSSPRCSRASLPDSCEAHPQRLFSVHTSDFRTWSPPRSSTRRAATSAPPFTAGRRRRRTLTRWSCRSASTTRRSSARSATCCSTRTSASASKRCARRSVAGPPVRGRRSSPSANLERSTVPRADGVHRVRRHDPRALRSVPPRRLRALLQRRDAPLRPSPLQASREWRVRVRGGERPRLVRASSATAAPSRCRRQSCARSSPRAPSSRQRAEPPPPRPPSTACRTTARRPTPARRPASSRPSPPRRAARRQARPRPRGREGDADG